MVLIFSFSGDDLHAELYADYHAVFPVQVPEPDDDAAVVSQQPGVEPDDDAVAVLPPPDAAEAGEEQHRLAAEERHRPLPGSQD